MKRTCAMCGGPLPKGSRSDRETCSDVHRVQWNRWRVKIDNDFEVVKAYAVRNVDDSLTVGQVRYLMTRIEGLRNYYAGCLDNLARMVDQAVDGHGIKIGVQTDFADNV